MAKCDDKYNELKNLKACPLCGAKGISVIRKGEVWEHWHIKCAYCFVHTQTYRTKLEAVLEWEVWMRPDDLDKAKKEINRLQEKVIDATIKCLIQWGGIDGAHHKDWTIDQALRILAGDKYDEVIRESCDGEDGPNTYIHEIGIAP